MTAFSRLRRFFRIARGQRPKVMPKLPPVETLARTPRRDGRVGFIVQFSSKRAVTREKRRQARRERLLACWYAMPHRQRRAVEKRIGQRLNAVEYAPLEILAQAVAIGTDNYHTRQAALGAIGLRFKRGEPFAIAA